jgi:hypothetical protein
MGGTGTFSTITTRSCHELFGTILSWNGIGAAMNSKTTVQTLPGRVALELCWCGEVEGLFPAIWSLGCPTKNRWTTLKVQQKSSFVRGVVVTSESVTHPEAFEMLGR